MKKYIPLVIRTVVTIILIQTLRLKFTAHEDSVYIFSKIGLEPHGRIGVGIIELIAGILLLIPRTVWLGALITISVIGSAIFLHLTRLGIVINNDGGILFGTAIFTFILAIIIVVCYKKDIPHLNL